MYYEILVIRAIKRNGQFLKNWQGNDLEYSHFFATAERSLTDKKTAIEAAQMLKQTFKEPEFKVKLTHRRTTTKTTEIEF